MCHFLSLSPLIFQPLRFTEQIPVSFSQTELMPSAMNDAARNGRSCAVKTLILPPPSPKPPQLSPYNCLQFHLTHQTSTYVKSSQRLNWTFSIIPQLHSTESTILVHSIRRISLHGTNDTVLGHYFNSSTSRKDISSKTLTSRVVSGCNQVNRFDETMANHGVDERAGGIITASNVTNWRSHFTFSSNTEWFPSFHATTFSYLVE